MALIMYLNRAPRYEGIAAADTKLIESFFRWKHENEVKGKYSGGSFEKWSGHSESELPNLYVVKHFYESYKKRTMYVEGLGTQEVYSVFEQLSRLVKANQIFNWFYKNIMQEKADQNYYEVTKEQLETLLDVCRKVKDGFSMTSDGKYIVNENIAKELLPVLENRGYFFGSINYDENYANHIVEIIPVIENILRTTDFENQIIYFNAIW